MKIAVIVLGSVMALATEAQQPPPEQRVETVIARQMALRHIPGLSLGVVKDGRLIFAKGYGKAALEWNADATPDTVYLLASVTKQFTATLVMMLVRDGNVRLDDPLAKFLTAPPQWTAITIRHLLTHTSGLKDRFEAGPDGRFFLSYTTPQMLDAASKTPTDFAPGAQWQYSDQGYLLLGAVIEKASGKSYGELLNERILVPLGMTSTTLHDWRAIVPRRADVYALEGDKLVGSRRRYQFGLVSHYGVQTTVTDLAKYDAALTAGTLLPAATLDEMWTPARLNDGTAAQIAGIGYGFGWFLEKFRGHREVHHGGTTGTCVYRLPDDKLSVIVLSNLDQSSGSDPCGIARIVAGQYVPAIGYAGSPAADDPNAARGARFRAAIEAFAKGTPDAADYARAYFPAMQQATAQQHAAFASLGPILSFQLVADDTLAAEVIWYRARYAQATVQFKFVLDGAGRIVHLSAQ